MGTQTQVPLQQHNAVIQQQQHLQIPSEYILRGNDYHSDIDVMAFELHHIVCAYGHVCM